MTDDLNFEYILDAFSFLPDWESRYEFIEDLGKKMPIMDDANKIDEYRVHECMSIVWVKADTLDTHGIVQIEGDSDTSTIKGIVAILYSIYRGMNPEQILETDTDAKFDLLGLFEHLSPTRHVGVYAIVEKIRRQAQGLLNS